MPAASPYTVQHLSHTAATVLLSLPCTVSNNLEEASALRDIAHMPARVKCAVLGWRTLKEALTGEDAEDDEDEF